jgi:uncharacterized hydrophobic protein (TIGR00271 family)
MTDSKDQKPEENNKKDSKPINTPSPTPAESEKIQAKIDKDTKKMKKEVTRSFSSFLNNIGKLLKDILDIKEGSDPDKTREAIVHDIEFRGANVWSLIASIFIASIGLNMNSTAVVIGAMLISPLMGPIIGLGYSIAINDLTLLIKSIKNFGVMVVLAITTSTFYFWISPLSAASAELIGRTQPTLLDLFVAIFGGIAGIVSISKSERTNVIPGVAIATALIPPLCTAGYGIADGNFMYFLGASYLFLINSVFISLAAFVIIRYLRFPFKEHVDPKRQKKVKRVMIYISILVMIPSAYTFWNAIEKFNFESQSSIFIDEVCNSPGSKILKSDFIFEKDTSNFIDLYVIGETIDSSTIGNWNRSLADFRLKNTVLRVFQDRDIEHQTVAMDDIEKNVKIGIIEELYQKNHLELASKQDRIQFLESKLAQTAGKIGSFIKLDEEIKRLEPFISNLSIGESYFKNDSNQVDTVYTLLISWDKKMKKNGKKKSEISTRLGNWMEVRLGIDSVLVVDVK